MPIRRQPFTLLSKAVEAGAGRTEIATALALAQSLNDPSEQLPRTFEGHTDSIYSVSWSPDGRFALSGSYYPGTKEAHKPESAATGPTVAKSPRTNQASGATSVRRYGPASGAMSVRR